MLKQLRAKIGPGRDGRGAGHKEARLKQSKKDFDFYKYTYRHIALKFLYLGWDYCGLARQLDTENTIEETLFAALEKARLIVDRQGCQYQRCGRTDKGVSAFEQVVNLYVRTSLVPKSAEAFAPDQQTKRTDLPAFHVMDTEKAGLTDGEMDYAYLLNNILPKDIRVTAWAPAPPAFSSRFSCTSRSYKYYFQYPNRAQMDLRAMAEACTYFIGAHDFRHFCKMDIKQGIAHFNRTIHRFEIQYAHSADLSEPVTDANYDAVPDNTALTFYIEGTAFLWHQVRCMAAVLFLVGRRLEPPRIVRDLLEPGCFAGRPQYTLASEQPLVLFQANYSPAFDWIKSPKASMETGRILRQQLSAFNIKVSVVKGMLSELAKETDALSPTADELAVLGYRRGAYVPLSARKQEESFEARTSKP